PMDVVVEKMVLLARHFVNAVYVDRIQWMGFGDRKLRWPPVNLSGAREHNFDFRINRTAGFENRKLRLAIDFQVRHRVRHRIEMAGLAGEIERVILALTE